MIISMKTTMKVYYLLLVLLLAGSAGVQAQIAIGSDLPPHKGAVLDLKSTNQGLLLPNVHLGNVNVLQVVASPTATEKTKATGMVVYNTNASVTGGTGAGIYVWNGSKWMTAGSSFIPELPVVSVTGVSLDMETASIYVGSSETLTATVEPANATNKSVTWLTSNGSVATVSGGEVTAVGPGVATITVKTVDGNKTATCTVTVTAPTIAVTGVIMNRLTTSIYIGNKEKLTPLFTPANATNQSVTWSSDNESVATVSSNGVVTAHEAGEAIIKAQTVDGNKIASCLVTVLPEPATVEFAGLWWMDRNLGVDPSIDPNPEEYVVDYMSNVPGELNGDLFQWGRQADGHEKMTSGTYLGVSISDEDLDENGQIKSTHPAFGQFWQGSDAYKYDWRSTPSDFLWNPDNSVNPCPKGFRIPTKDEFVLFMETISDDDLRTLTTTHHAVKVANGQLSFPTTFIRDTGSSWVWPGPSCIYWTATAEDQNYSAYCAQFDPYYTTTGTYWSDVLFNPTKQVEKCWKSAGLAIRCVKK